ncbi:MAG: uroporphyrinogen-III C-methyltransferase [Saprospiraceae bacterium]|jgi:uroporphyrin-III C-methyltransferase|nr:uroporphyrinogen-III C-methyltransferase [Saprospiraceae bacterium]
MKQINPRVSIVGAGPGDPDLLTIKAWKAIKSADVILYDALVSAEILGFAPAEALKIYVGKRSSDHTYSQEKINEMIVSNALLFGHVVRLKGGDPFVFGRGGEEMEYVRKSGLPVSIIPGISSSIGVPGIIGIPVTHRGLSESFWVVTATDMKGNLAKDIQKAAETDATVVVLMGLSKLDQIVNLYLRKNKNDVPVAIIQNGTLSNQKILTGKISDIVIKAAAEEIKAPAVIVIGEVVNLYAPSQIYNQVKNVLA